MKDKLKLNENLCDNGLSQNNSNTEQSQMKKNRLQFFDFTRDYESKRSYTKLNSLDKEFYRFNLEASKNVNPIEFGKSNKENYPIYEVFLRIFCVPATSVPSEQLFSAANYSVWDRRNKLCAENVRKIMFIVFPCKQVPPKCKGIR